jgi:hypothetical protein
MKTPLRDGLITLFAAALCTTAAAAEYAKDKDKPKDLSTATEAKFKSLDRNDDQQLSKSEAREDQTVSTHFASLDLNADGFVSKSEYTAQMSDKSWDKPR